MANKKQLQNYDVYDFNKARNCDIIAMATNADETFELAMQAKQLAKKLEKTVSSHRSGLNYLVTMKWFSNRSIAQFRVMGQARDICREHYKAALKAFNKASKLAENLSGLVERKFIDEERTDELPEILMRLHTT